MNGIAAGAGIWLVLQIAGHRLPVRIPLRETVRLWTPDMASVPPDLLAAAPAGTACVARHRLWIVGIHTLTLDYAIAPGGSDYRQAGGNSD